MTPDDERRIRMRLDGMMVEVRTGRDGVWDAGSYCHRCVVETILNGEDMEEKRE